VNGKDNYNSYFPVGASIFVPMDCGGACNGLPNGFGAPL